MQPLLFETAYLGSVDRFAAIARAKEAKICLSTPFNKRNKCTHRCDIADANGIISLTVPIVKPDNMRAARWNDIIVSGHNQWWNIHFNTLKSAYGRTPYFEFYEDDFASIINNETEGKRLVDFNASLTRLILRLAGIDTPVEFSESTTTDSGIWWKNSDMEVVPYYQTRMQRHGFTPHLSIVDLLFNHGPETALILRAGS